MHPALSQPASRLPEASPIRPRVVFAIILLCHAALGLYFLQFHSNNLNPDAISYLSIAMKYRAGNFWDAINGYWSPLFSWLLAPFLPLAWSPVVVSRAVAVAASAGLIVGARALSYRFAMTEVVRGALMVALVPVAVNIGLRNRPPDMLVAITLLFYLSIILDDRYRQTSRGWGCGVLGGLSFFAKSYGLPFFLAHFVALNGLHYWRGETSLERRQVLRNCFSGLLMFTIISGAWVAALSTKYGGLTISTAARFNFSDLRNAGYPHNRMLLAPPNPSAASYWEDPVLALRGRTPGSVNDFPQHPPVRGKQKPSRLSSIPNKLRRCLVVLQSFSIFSIAILIGAAWLARPWAPISAGRNRAQDVLLTLTIYCGGYSLLFIEPRYLWVAWPLVMIVGFHLASSVLTIRNVLAVQVPVALSILAFAASCWVEPWAFLQGAKEPAVRNIDQGFRSLQQSGVHGRIASDIDWGRMQTMAFYNRWQYYGITGHGTNGRDVRRELTEHDIDYYFVWDPDFNVDADWKQVSSGPFRRLRIYSLKEPR